MEFGSILVVKIQPELISPDCHVPGLSHDTGSQQNKYDRYPTHLVALSFSYYNLIQVAVKVKLPN